MVCKGRGSDPSPTPGCFWQRVWNCLKRNELSFAEVQKSSEEYEKAEVRCWKLEVGDWTRRRDRRPPIPPAICMNIKRKDLHEGQFISA
jgi:hypothetical protein